MLDGERWYCLALKFCHSVLSSEVLIIRRSVSIVGTSGPALVSELNPKAPPSRLLYQ